VSAGRWIYLDPSKNCSVLSTIDTRIPLGIDGADEVLHGGLLPARSYMLRGEAGTGKTIFGFHYLTAGVEAGESCLFVAFEEPTEDIRANAAALGFDLEGVEILDLSPDASEFLDSEQYSVFAPEEVDEESVTDRIVEAVERVDPDRVFVDPLTQLQYLSADDYQFRQEVAGLMSYLENRGATVLFTTQPTPSRPDDDLQYLCDGALALERSEYGRSFSVLKFRGSDFQGGSHTLRIDGTGVSVYPKLVPGEYDSDFSVERVGSGVDELDSLLGGGIERGSVTVVSGPSGVGKTTTSTHFLTEAAARGETAAAFLFEETESSFRHRSDAIGLPTEELIADGDLTLEYIEPLSISSDEFAHKVKTAVEDEGASVVMIDGTAGYRLSLRGREDELVSELHALVRYLRNVGVTVILAEEVRSITGEFQPSSENISYLADNILFLRYLEVRGEIRKAVGVLKKRLGDFEPTLRELRITGDGMWIGDPLDDLRGVLTGTPEWRDDD
jgi:circadian clock protein KaiC